LLLLNLCTLLAFVIGSLRGFLEEKGAFLRQR
jgi:hypothetical protein